tara:strand:- start:872 stop:1609 length:738 start_codon:yes stop_codon:yes gene_type:complete
MSLVSIIIPYYKKKDDINTTINSILNQNFKNYEIIIVYDDENKEDLKLIQEIKQKDERIKLLINERNLGAGESRNRGIKIARGKFIAFIDADDIWKPLKLSKQIDFMIKNNFSITHTSYNIVNDEKKIIGLRQAKNLIFSNLLKSCDIGLSTVILEKKILNDNKFAKLNTKEDYVLWLNLSKDGHEFKALNESLTDWRLSKNSLSASTLRKLIDGYKVYRIYLRQSIVKSVISLLTLSLNFLKKQ